jgi:DNA-binding response OmpR family regulator
LRKRLDGLGGAESQLNSNQSARILCLDDDPLSLATRKALLELAGHGVIGISSAEEALQLFSSEHVDLVITDHLLSGTLGTHVAESMKRLKPEVPILIISGLTEPPEKMEFADGFLCKLEPPPVLLATVVKLLGLTSDSAAKATA